MRTCLLLFGLAACGAGTQVADQVQRPPCAGTQLQAGMPRPHSPYVSALTWLDGGALVIAVGATTFEAPDGDGGTGTFRDTSDAAGLVVLDANTGALVRAWHGVDPYLLAPRRGTTDEVLFAELARASGGARAGRIDVISGCMTSTPWTPDTSVELDPDDDELVVAHDVDKSHSVELLDVSTLSPVASGHLPPHAFMMYDAASHSLVALEPHSGSIETRDPRTLALRARRDLGVEIWSWTLRPAHRQLVGSYVSRCKLESHHGSEVMEAVCAHGSVTRWGLVRISLDTLADVARTVEARDDDIVDLRRVTWPRTGAEAIVQCKRIGDDLCIWDPDTGTTRPLAPMSLDYTIRQIAWRDDDVFAAPTPDWHVVVRSHSRGAVLGTFALPHL